MFAGSVIILYMFEVISRICVIVLKRTVFSFVQVPCHYYLINKRPDREVLVCHLLTSESVLH